MLDLQIARNQGKFKLAEVVKGSGWFKPVNKDSLSVPVKIKAGGTKTSVLQMLRWMLHIIFLDPEVDNLKATDYLSKIFKPKIFATANETSTMHLFLKASIALSV
jgi:hypothetical protein